MTLRLIARPSGILVPRKDFGLQGIGPSDLILGDDIGYVASLLLGFDGNEPRLLQVDNNRSLRVTMAGQAASSQVQIVATQGGNVAVVSTPADGAAAQIGIFTWGQAAVFNGASFDRARSASAANLAATSGLGAALADQPGDWSVFSAPAVSVAASASRAAGGVGVRHVCTGLTFGFSATTALAAIATVTVNLRDGATGAGTILKSLQFTLPAAVVAPFAIQLTGLHLVGSAATAMTVEFAAAIGNLLTFCDLSGHDAA